jgi:putative ABC transport system permease protein
VSFIKLLRIALRNILRNRRKSFITLTTIIIGLTALITVRAILEGSERQTTDNLIRIYTGHIRINAQGYRESSGSSFIDVSISQPQRIKQIFATESHITQFTSRIKFGALVSTGEKSFNIIGLGIEPDKESKMSNLLNVIEGENLSVSNMDGVLLGSKLAATLGKTVGNKVTLVAQTPDGVLNAADLKVKGIIKTGFEEVDASFLFLTLKKAQELLNLDNRVTEMILLLDQANKAEKIAKGLSAKFRDKGIELEVYSWQELLVPIVKLWNLFKRVTDITNMFVLIAVGMSIFSILSMAVSERIREIGIMMAMGTRQRQVLMLFLLEGLILGIIGAGLGCALGSLVTQYYVIVGISAKGVWAQQFLPIGDAIHAYLSWGNILFSFLSATFITLLAAFLPSFHASRLQPTEALRHI